MLCWAASQNVNKAQNVFHFAFIDVLAMILQNTAILHNIQLFVKEQSMHAPCFARCAVYKHGVVLLTLCYAALCTACTHCRVHAAAFASQSFRYSCT